MDNEIAIALENLAVIRYELTGSDVDRADQIHRTLLAIQRQGTAAQVVVKVANGAQ